MPAPLALCLEDLDAAPSSDRYLQCVAASGSEPGLGLAADGAVLWRELALACELWVSADERLVLLRREDAPPVTVSREGRALEAPAGRPVVLCHGDELRLGGRRLRLHLHGRATAVTAPRPLRERVGQVAAALAVGALVGAAPVPGSADPGPGPIEVRDHPPKPVAPPPPKAEPKKPDKKKHDAKKPAKKAPKKKGEEKKE